MTTRDLVLSATFAAVIVALGAVPPIPIGIVPVPITLQTLGVMLAGAVLGPLRGALAAALVIALVLIGLPVLSGGRGGATVLAGPTAGFLLGWVPGAFVTGCLAGRGEPAGTLALPRLARLFAACAVGGIAIVYAAGILWLAAVSGVALRTAAWGTLLFLPGDLIKAALAAFVAASLERSGAIRAG